MAIEGTLKVTPQQLKSTSGEFSTTGRQITSLTAEMMSKVTAMSSVWQGDASTAYINKFRSLQDDIEKMNRMVQEHVTDLNAMADAYETAEKANVEAVSSLSGDVIS